MRGRAFIEELRRELQELNRRVEEHPYLSEAEGSLLPKKKLRLFVENQYYIVYHDLRSLALMVSRASNSDEAEYLSRLQEGDLMAFQQLIKLGEELEVPFRGLSGLRILPAAVSYTHYLAWLALYASTAEQVAALIVNLPVWGQACGRLASALKKNYSVKSTGFLDAFAQPPAWIEEEGARIIERYLPGVEERARMAARMIQSYELSFWDAIYSG
ncbi:MAG: TenA family transcriptional regulator [Nitrososphaerota archaeon]